MGTGGQANDSLSCQRNLVTPANRSSRRSQSFTGSLSCHRNLGASPCRRSRTKHLEVCEVANRVRESLQIGAIGQVNRVEARPAAK